MSTAVRCSSAVFLGQTPQGSESRDPNRARLFEGHIGWFQGDRAIGLGVVELADEARTFSRMAEVAAELRDEDGADVLIMGCAGMARYRDRLQRHVGLPVVEPSQAAVSMAIGRSRLGWES